MIHYFNEVKNNFLNNLDVKENTKKLYSTNIEYFKKWVVIEGRNIRKLERSDILAYKSYLIEKKLSGNTIESYLKAIRLFYKYTENVGEHDNISAGIKLKGKMNTHTKIHLEIDEINKLYSVIDRESLKGKRDYAIINLMLRSGLRCVEVSRMRVCDINTYKSEYLINVFRKGDEIRSQQIGLTHKAMDPILEYLNYRGVTDDNEPVFLTHCSTGEKQLSPTRIGRIVKSYMIKSGVYTRQKTSHSLRHTAAVMAILHDASIKEVQQMLGHKRIETTEIYLESINGKLRRDNPAVHKIDEAF